ncbi:transglycosylase SLT domain-containing protein [Ferrimonas lipolytica]|uniref:Transglycosylase SLT domain-containing protein n=1 Tax=Ferrimonas lipolytica TaxID=2724191 RepID=A0A6H1UAH1_9GAMM|nr:transglycosylase SLT domain-containing protein [Ferrimonas lipolytica]QIZ76057.1 transglycosylase SLT domain-containing protein [Ferrimonas lipolytica]
MGEQTRVTGWQRWCRCSVLTMLLAVVACGQQAPPEQQQESINAPAPTKVAPVSVAPLDDVWPILAQPSGGDLDEMLARGEIRILTTFTLGWYYIEQGQPSGITYQLTQLFERYVHKTLGDKAKGVKVTVIPVRRDQLLMHLNNGHGDLVFANMTITAARQEQIDFSTPLTSSAREVLVTGVDYPALQGITDLSGATVVVRKESSYYQSLLRLNDELQERGMKPVNIQLADPRLEDEDLMQMVAQGHYPASVVDEHKTWPWQLALAEMKVHQQVALREHGRIAFGLRKNSPQLNELIDGFAETVSIGSKEFNMLVNRYLKRGSWVKSALSDEAFDRADEMIPLFKKYGEKYQLDWVLLMSFAYQESRFNPKARSHAGAIGVMQVMPSTAKDKRVNIDNIYDLENNIHAGTKYLSVLRDRYFNEPQLSDFNRTVFAMAAYNAGPNRINRLRRQASKRGFDSDVWFQNVENLVAAQVGQEPITYVSNIYRFYIIYKRVLAEATERDLIRERLQVSPPQAPDA